MYKEIMHFTQRESPHPRTQLEAVSFHNAFTRLPHWLPLGDSQPLRGPIIHCHTEMGLPRSPFWGFTPAAPSDPNHCSASEAAITNLPLLA